MDIAVDRLLGRLLPVRLPGRLGWHAARALFRNQLTPFIDPARIRRKVPYPDRKRRPGGFVVSIAGLGGAVPVDETRTARKVRDLMAHVDDPRGSQTYAELVARGARGDAARKDGDVIDTPERVEAYCRRYI
ncbi:MAG: hypothetical protein KIT81_08460, partial [Alphaproteobacteria bacterium]|nr:hypothetical protein [Alphaproteobacteria bacterium]